MFILLQRTVILLLVIASFSLYAVNENIDNNWKNIANYNTSAFDLNTPSERQAAQIQIGNNLAKTSKNNTDLQKAKYWYEQAATSGSAEAMYLLAQYNDFQPENSPNFNITLSWLKKAAEKKHLQATMKLSRHYIANGSTEEAIIWLTQAISLGEPEAGVMLGDLYFQGSKTLNKNLEKANSYYQAGAIKGNSASQLRLGVIYYKGFGTLPDIIEAYKWVKLSSLNGNQSANSYLKKELLPNMTQQQVDIGNTFVNEFKPVLKLAVVKEK